MRPELTVKDRSWKTGVSSGQVKDRFEQTTETPDMEVTSWRGGRDDTSAPAADRWEEGTTARPRRRRFRAPAGGLSGPGITRRCRRPPPCLGSSTNDQTSLPIQPQDAFERENDRLPDALNLQDEPLTREHGGPVRLAAEP
ncbi:hypothetical protein GCM10020367_67250 [Streptomyces sannanensis]|uniref:Uncharacterized protein n=1 Tax=Streptomyces sannanensis TaxID=285536 RepID=A0ABP6SM87_9ACTN